METSKSLPVTSFVFRAEENFNRGLRAGQNGGIGSVWKSNAKQDEGNWGGCGCKNSKQRTYLETWKNSVYFQGERSS